MTCTCLSMPASVSFSLLLRVLGVKTTSLEARATPPSPRAGARCPARTRPPRGPQPARSAFRALDHADGCGFARRPVLGHTHRAAHSSVPRPSASPDKRPLGSRPPQPSRSKGLSCSARTQTGFPAHVSDVRGGSAVRLSRPFQRRCREPTRGVTHGPAPWRPGLLASTSL